MLQRPIFTPVVIGFWCVTTGWLMAAKILPTLQSGSPPGQQALYASGSRLVPVAWTVFCNEEPIGWALTQTSRSAHQGILVDSHLHFERLPWKEMLPGWATLLMQRLTPNGDVAALDARGRLAIDERGQLSSFSSVVNLPGTDQPVVLTGTVDAGSVTINVVAGELRYETTRHLPTDLMIADELSPQATLPELHEGRRWTVPVYSPLRAGQSPLEILHAEVGSAEMTYWEGNLVQARVVTYRVDPTSDGEPRCRLWVDRTGRVLRQEAALLGAHVAFVRRPDAEAARMAAGEPRAALPNDPRNATTATGEPTP